ncbi:MAG: NAD-dependent epimerase/dehydratase family protein [Paludibacter sp.]|nr:NAD-dependent epimerase/dehydratase family protein [Paludibacter sp.]
MRYFVTGCTGFIGIHLCRLLLAEGHEVYGLVRNPQKIPQDFKGKLKVIRGGLEIFEQSDLQLPEVDVVIHLAAIITSKRSSDYRQINHEAVVHLLDVINHQAWKPKRFILASSLAAAGPNRKGEVLRESDTPQPIDPYGIAKLKAEQLLEGQPFATTVFRPPMVVGPGDPAMLTVFKMVKANFAALPMGTPQLLSFIYVDDLVQAIHVMSQNHSAARKLYFVTSEEVVTNREIVDTIASEMNKKIFLLSIPKFLIKLIMYLSTAISVVFRVPNFYDYRQYKQMTTPSFICTSELLSAETGWKAKTKFSEAIKFCVEGYKKLGWL